MKVSNAECAALCQPMSQTRRGGVECCTGPVRSNGVIDVGRGWSCRDSFNINAVLPACPIDLIRPARAIETPAKIDKHRIVKTRIVKSRVISGSL